MDRLSWLAGLLWRGLRSYVFLLLLTLLIIYLAFIYFIGRPKVALVSMSDIILGRETAHEIVRMLRWAADNRSIKAVVLEIDSLGGDVSSTEEVYLNVVQLRKKKPVVAYINVWGVSGAYYVAAGADYIYAKPSSYIGNVGAVALLPERETPDEFVIFSGPFKRTGWSEREITRQIEMTKLAFLDSVLTQRRGRLKIDPAELTTGAVWVGMEGVKYGLVDALGSSTDAIEKAASLAHVSNYAVVDVNKELGVKISFPELQGRGGGSQGKLKLPLESSPAAPTNYYLYLPPR